MLDTSNSVATVRPPSHGDTIAIIGRREGAHLRVVSINPPERFLVAAVCAGELLHSSCYLHADERCGYDVRQSVRHLTPAPALDVHATVRGLLSAKRFNALLGIQHSDGPIDVLRCGVAVGDCTFFIREFADGNFVAVFDDGERQTQSPASADDWNALVEAWHAADATYGDAQRVRIAERFFRSRGWMPQGVYIFDKQTRGEQ